MAQNKGKNNMHEKEEQTRLFKVTNEIKKNIYKKIQEIKQKPYFSPHFNMFYDFNIPYPNAPDRADFSRIEKILDRIQSSMPPLFVMFKSKSVG
jgi:hypothetical protein